MLADLIENVNQTLNVTYSLPAACCLLGGFRKSFLTLHSHWDPILRE